MSGNPLSSDLIVLLKRQKNFGKSLKRVALKGIILNSSVLKKEGIRVDAMKDSKIVVGDLTLIV